MEICFEPENVVLKVQWTKNDNIQPSNEYINCWTAILRYVEVLKPVYLLMDASELDYKILPEISLIFNEISQKLLPEKIAIVVSNSVSGREMINNLILYSPVKGHNIFDDISKRTQWFETCLNANFH